MDKPAHPDKKPRQKTDDTADPASQTRKELPLISVPTDQDMIAEEMEELFEEDRVTHKHGSSEPEAD